MTTIEHYYSDDSDLAALVGGFTQEQQQQQLPCQQSLDVAEERYLEENYGKTRRNWTQNQLLVQEIGGF